MLPSLELSAADWCTVVEMSLLLGSTTALGDCTVLAVSSIVNLLTVLEAT